MRILSVPRACRFLHVSGPIFGLKAEKVPISEVLRSSAKVTVGRHEYKQWEDDIGTRGPRKYRTELEANVLPRAERILLEKRSGSRKDNDMKPKRIRLKTNTIRNGADTIDTKVKEKPKAAISKKTLAETKKSKKAYKLRPEHTGEHASAGKGKGEHKRARSRRREKSGEKTGRSRVIVRGRGGLAPLLQARAPETRHIPRLSHGLDRVLFSPGVHFLQDPRTRVYNFTPYLKKIVPLDDFDMDKVTGFVAANKDKVLLEHAIENGKKYYSSTLSMTLALHQMYLFFNNYSPGATHRFNFTPFSRTATTLPLSVIVEPKGEHKGEKIYSVTADKSADTEIMLSAMGHCLEALLTNDETAFQAYLKTPEAKDREAESIQDNSVQDKSVQDNTQDKSVQDTASKENSPDGQNTSSSAANVYNYLVCGPFLMRSQLDCFDPRLPGSGTFDVKTRAACAVRYDRADPDRGTYQIWKQHGRFESFEREYADLIRTGALLKYAFQARIGQMDGVFVAYHNVASFFGFQYLPVGELDRVFYSDSHAERKAESTANGFPDDNLPTHVAEAQFKALLALWADLMDCVRSDLARTPYADMPFRLVLKRKAAPDARRLYLYAWAVPMPPHEIAVLQESPQLFATLFRAQVTHEQRAENIEAARRHLDALNAKHATQFPVLAYRALARALFDGSPCDSRHPYPLLSSTRLEYAYEIERLHESVESTPKTRETLAKKTENPKERKTHPENTGDSRTTGASFESLSSERPLGPLARQFLTQMRAVSRMLTAFDPNTPIVDQMRDYARVGARRAEKWKHLEDPAVVYSPLEEEHK